jgi:hypothetical protein
MSQEEEEDDDSQPTASTSGSNNFLERAKYIPLRLQLEERRLLRLLEAALSVSEYTDKVDVLSWKSKTSRIHTQIKDICAILCGLVVAQDYKKGQQLVRVSALRSPQMQKLDACWCISCTNQNPSSCPISQTYGSQWARAGAGVCASRAVLAHVSVQKHWHHDNLNCCLVMKSNMLTIHT